VALGDVDRLQLVEVANGQARDLAPVPGPIYRLATRHTPDGLWIACGCQSDVAAWRVAAGTNEPQLVLRGDSRYDSNVELLEFPGGEPGWLVVAGRPVRRSATGQAVIDVWSLAARQASAVSVDLAQQPLALSADGRWIAVAMPATAVAAAGARGEVVELLDLGHLQLLQELNVAPIPMSTENPLARR
jgi:hypothetical protein